MILSRNNSGWNSFYRSPPLPNNKDDVWRSLVVPTMSIEEAMERYKIARVDFLKMDCEGAEADILLGGRQRVLRAIGKISMETHGRVEEIVALLRTAGFAVTTRGLMLYARRPPSF